jgi:hypothetical protein
MEVSGTGCRWSHRGAGTIVTAGSSYKAGAPGAIRVRAICISIPIVIIAIIARRLRVDACTSGTLVCLSGDERCALIAGAI